MFGHNQRAYIIESKPSRTPLREKKGVFAYAESATRVRAR